MFWPLFFATAVLGLAAVRARLATASVVLAASVLFYGAFGNSTGLFVLFALACLSVLLPLNVPALRQEWLSRPMFFRFRRLLPALDPDTLAALDAGSAGWDFGLLRGEFDWNRFEALPAAAPNPLERSLIDALVSQFRALCAERTSAGARAQWLRDSGVLGMSISREHGGLGLSALAQSALLTQLAALDPQTAGIVGSPVRLAWIDLLQRHGTRAQAARFLPGLARGEERIARVCEALAGTAIAVHTTQPNGASAIGLRLRLNAILTGESGESGESGEATLLAMVVQVQDPSGLLDPAAHSGPSCLLLARRTPGLRVTEMIEGEALVIAEDVIVGGNGRIGRGLVDLQSATAVAGGIASPAVHAGIAATAGLVAGAYARSHTPFLESPGTRATAQEALASIGAVAYAAQALASGSAQAFDCADPPLAPAAFARSVGVEQGRRIAAAAADLGLADSSLRSIIDFATTHGGCAMPARLARPIDYTVRVLSGHGAFMRALAAARNPSAAQGLEVFDLALWQHFGHVLAYGSRALVLALSAGMLSTARMRSPLARRIGQRVNRYSAALAFAADIALSRVGLDLASSRSFTARRSAHEAARLTLTTWLGDALAQLWLTVCALKMFDDAGAQTGDRAILEWICADALRSVEDALDRVLRQLSSPTLALFTRLIIFPLGRGARAPRDAANRLVAQRLLDGARLRAGLAQPTPRLATLASALTATLDGEALEERASAAAPGPGTARIEQALASGLIDPGEAQQMLDWLYAIRELEHSPS